MSKYWNNMNILKKVSDMKNLFISDTFHYIENKNFENKNFEIKTGNYTDKDLEEISNFYCNNLLMIEDNNLINIYVSDLKRYINLDCAIVVLKVDNRIIGSMISILTPIKIKTDLNKSENIYSDLFKKIKTERSYVFGCSSFLALNYKYREKGFGMKIIQSSLKIHHENGGLGAYFINKISRCNNSIKFNSWYIELNKKINQTNTNFVKVDDTNIIEAYKFYINYGNDKKFYFDPSFEYWIKWVKSFPTYYVIEKDIITSLFFFDYKSIYYPISRKIVNIVNLILFIGDTKNFNSCITIAKEKYDILVIYELGDISSNVLKNINANISNTRNYINFYNTAIKLKSEEIYIPIF